MNGYGPEREERFMRDALERVRSMPGVTAAALTTRAPLDVISYGMAPLLVSGLHGPADRGDLVPRVAVSPDYFETLRGPLLQGRAFTAADTSETPLVAVVSEALADRYWSVETAVGQRLLASQRSRCRASRRGIRWCGRVFSC